VRKLTTKELARIYEEQVCPFCPAPLSSFILGPRGGMARNMTCAGCSASINILAPDYWARWPGAKLGEVIAEPTRAGPH